MAHQRVLEFPPSGTGQLAASINALEVGSLTLYDNSGGSWSVSIQVQNSTFGAAFNSLADAQSFFDLWASRVEDAR